jgi:hypothetical protein
MTDRLARTQSQHHHHAGRNQWQNHSPEPLRADLDDKP